MSTTLPPHHFRSRQLEGEVTLLSGPSTTTPRGIPPSPSLQLNSSLLPRSANTSSTATRKMCQYRLTHYGRCGHSVSCLWKECHYHRGYAGRCTMATNVPKEERWFMTLLCRECEYRQKVEEKETETVQDITSRD